jgi:hypothetical protein
MTWMEMLCFEVLNFCWKDWLGRGGYRDGSVVFSRFEVVAVVANPHWTPDSTGNGVSC